MLGRSPDYADALMMRMYFVIDPPYVGSGDDFFAITI